MYDLESRPLCSKKETSAFHEFFFYPLPNKLHLLQSKGKNKRDDPFPFEPKLKIFSEKVHTVVVRIYRLSTINFETSNKMENNQLNSVVSNQILLPNEK